MAERFAADGYKIMQSVKINGLEIVIAENPDAEKPYMTWRRSLSMPFGAESHMIPIYDRDYLEVLQAFIRCQTVCADQLGLGRIYRGPPLVDYPLGVHHCVPDGMNMDLKGQVVALRADILLPEYRSRSHQLMLATGGFGCSPTARGRAVYGVNLYLGEEARWDRSDILGVIAENTLPGWAHKKLSKLRESPEKVSVIAKIREAKENPTPQQKKPQTGKSHDPEL